MTTTDLTTTLEFEAEVRPQLRKRVANDYMRHGLRRLDPNDEIPFFCECDRDDCFASVWLTGLAYDRLSSKDLIVSDHEPAMPRERPYALSG
jgi:hypothetical protein